MTGPLPLTSSIGTPCSMAAPLQPQPYMSHTMLMAPLCTVTLPAPYHKPDASIYSFGLDSFPSQLDSLDSLSISDSQPGVLLCLLNITVTLTFGAGSNTQVTFYNRSCCFVDLYFKPIFFASTDYNLKLNYLHFGWCNY